MSWAAPCAKALFSMNGPSEAAHLLRLARKDHQAMRALSDPKVAAVETFGFHAQQAVEKALKAWLDLSGQLYPRIHDLDELFRRLRQHGATVPEEFAGLPGFFGRPGDCLWDCRRAFYAYMGKTITIDDEAYRILKSHKFEKESFSDVIKKQMAEALVGPELVTALCQAARAEKPHRKAGK